MDGKRFDQLSRTLAGGVSRRGAVKAIVAGVFGALGARAAASAEVSQAFCGNVVCAGNPGVCKPGCVCCVFGNGNSRCMPPGKCTGVITTPTTTTTTAAPTTTTTAAPTTTTTAAPTTTTTTAAPTTTTSTAPPTTTTTTTTTTAVPTTTTTTTTPPDPCASLICEDNNPCTIDSCADGVCSNTPVTLGTPCAAGGGSGTCDGSGVCDVSFCPTGQHECGNICVSDSTVETCGDRCEPCPERPNATVSCDGSACVYACLAGFSDCDGIAVTGCETNTGSDVQNCGGCVQVCSPNNGTASCVNGVCGITCNAGFADCDGIPESGCEAHLATNDMHCGSCGNGCVGGQVCIDSACGET